MGCEKVSKSDIQNNFSMSKISRFFFHIDSACESQIKKKYILLIFKKYILPVNYCPENSTTRVILKYCVECSIYVVILVYKWCFHYEHSF